MSDIRVLQRRAMEIRERYGELEVRRGEQPWDSRKLANGFKKDIEDLIEILNQDPVDRKKLDHELSDCLWSVLVLARKLDVDIEKSFLATMTELDLRLDKELK